MSILYNITEEHTFVSLQVNFNSKLQIVSDAIKIKNYQLLNLLKLMLDLSALSGNFRTQSPEKMKKNLYYKAFLSKGKKANDPFSSLI